MIYNNILVPFDGDEPSRKALELAREFISDDPAAAIHVVTVIEAGDLAAQMQSPTNRQGTPMLFPGADSYTEAIEKTIAKAREEIAECTGEMSEQLTAAIKVEATVSGKVAQGLVEYGETQGCDLIIMGRHGHSLLRGPLGGISYSVLQKADVPVLMI